MLEAGVDFFLNSVGLNVVVLDDCCLKGLQLLLLLLAVAVLLA